MSREHVSKPRDGGRWRDITSFWILGLCNNIGYTVMLSSAHDIIRMMYHKDHESDDRFQKERYCQKLSTGAILLADILPSMSVKLFMPFLPLWIHYRVAVAISLAVISYVLVSSAETQWMAIFGIALTSAACGLGEPTFLAYSSKYHKNVVSSWASGTGAAGLSASLLYATLRAANVSPQIVMLIMLFFPTVEALTFWFLLRSPRIVPPRNERIVFKEVEPVIGLREKLAYSRKIITYMVPLCVIYFFEYFINLGLYELTFFKNAFIDQSAQFRWYVVDYQLGAFVSRSSVNLFKIKHVYLLPIFQGINFIYFISEVLLFYTPSIWIVLIIVFWEGLLGGGTYVNTFYKVTQEIPPSKREFAMSMVAQSDSLGIAMAGFISLPVHNAICRRRGYL